MTFLDFLQRSLAHRDDEALLGVFLDGVSGFIACETLALGEAAVVNSKFRTVIARAIELGANKLVLAHNHPSGDPSPSLQDWAGTTRLRDVGSALGIEVLDHLVVTKTRVVRMSQLKKWHKMGQSIR